MKDILRDPLHMSHACHPFRKCYKTLTFCSLLTRCIIPEACQKCSESVSFLHFCLRNMLRVPQRHALFRHLNFQTCSDTEVFCTFCTSCTFRNDFVQHHPRNRPFMGFEGSHSAGEIGTGKEGEIIYIYDLFICISLFICLFIYL